MFSEWKLKFFLERFKVKKNLIWAAKGNFLHAEYFSKSLVLWVLVSKILSPSGWKQWFGKEKITKLFVQWRNPDFWKGIQRQIFERMRSYEI